MKKLILSAAILFSVTTVFAVNTIETDNGTKPAVKKERAKKSAKKATANTLLCQVLEIKDENNNSVTMAIFANAATTKNNNSNTYMNHMFFADVKVIAEAVAVDNYDEFVAVLKQRYTGIKISGLTK
jgi:hypothetical protein